jgi:hypothetical protein
LRIGVVALALVQCGFWLLAASITWTFRGLMVGVDSPRGHLDAVLSLAEFVWFAVNLAALLAFLIRRRGIGLWSIAAVTLLDVAATLAMGVWVMSYSFWEHGSEWWWATAVAAATLLLMYVLRRRLRITRAQSPSEPSLPRSSLSKGGNSPL